MFPTYFLNKRVRII